MCVALQEHMEWTRFGHAIVSPGWRVTLRTVREVYCGLSVNVSDAPAIENLRKTATWSRLAVKYFGESAPEVLKKARAE